MKSQLNLENQQMLFKKRILNTIKKNADTLKDCYSKAHKLSELLSAEAQEERNEQEETIKVEFNKKIALAKKDHDEKIQAINADFKVKLEKAQETYKKSMKKVNSKKEGNDENSDKQK